MIAILFALLSVFPLFGVTQSQKMAEISYTWYHPGEKNLVTFGDCCSESLFEDLDCEFDSEVSDGIVNVPDRVLESLGDFEAWAENFSRPTGRGHQRAKNPGEINSNTKTCPPPASASPPPPSADSAPTATPRQDPLPQARKQQLGLLRFNFDIYQ